MKEVKFNPFGLILFLMHKICFCWTPIHAEKYLSQYKQFHRSIISSNKNNNKTNTSNNSNNNSFEALGQSNGIIPTGGLARIRIANISTLYDADADDNSRTNASVAYDRMINLEGPSNQADRHHSEQEGHLPLGYLITHPGTLINLIKSYHLAGNKFLIGALVHFLILTHLLIKSIIVAVLGKPNTIDSQRYFKSTYYPYIVGAIPEFYLVNNLVLVLALYCLSLRALSAYRVIRGSIINRTVYKRVYTTQLNVVCVTYLKFTLTEWFDLFRRASQHAKGIKHGQAADANERLVREYRKHLSLKCSTRQREFESCSLNELIFQVNPIDHERCFKDVSLPKWNERDPAHQAWYSVGGPSRICICPAITSLCFCILGLIIIVTVGIVFFLCIIHLELRSSLARTTNAAAAAAAGPSTWSETWLTLYRHFLNPMHVIRSVELYLFLVMNIPLHIDSVLADFDLFVLVGQAKKLIQLFEYESKLIENNGAQSSILLEQTMYEDVMDALRHQRQTERRNDAEALYLPYESRARRSTAAATTMAAAATDQAATVTNNISTSTTIKDLMRINSTNLRQLSSSSTNGRHFSLNWVHREEERINSRLLHLIKLTNVLYYEFVEIRDLHSTYLNLAFVGGGICIAYTLAMISICKDQALLILLCISLLSSLVPILIVLTICAKLERKFKTLYITMVRLLVNKSNTISVRTLSYLRIASRLYEKKDGRAMLILGKYAITQDSLAPIIAYMATAILYLNRFVSYENSDNTSTSVMDSCDKANCIT